MRLYQAILVLCSCSIQGGLYADGMPIENGRFAGGPTTVLTMTRDQTAALNAAGKGNQRILVLTEGQRRRLHGAAGVAPVSLLIYNTREGEND